jgi:hypothetical protein
VRRGGAQAALAGRPRTHTHTHALEVAMRRTRTRARMSTIGHVRRGTQPGRSRRRPAATAHTPRPIDPSERASPGADVGRRSVGRSTSADVCRGLTSAPGLAHICAGTRPHLRRDSPGRRVPLLLPLLCHRAANCQQGERPRAEQRVPSTEEPNGPSLRGRPAQGGAERGSEGRGEPGRGGGGAERGWENVDAGGPRSFCRRIGCERRTAPHGPPPSV